jgi:hypothetical protein
MDSVKASGQQMTCRKGRAPTLFTEEANGLILGESMIAPEGSTLNDIERDIPRATCVE